MNKRILNAALMTATIAMPLFGTTVSVAADSFYANQSYAAMADITNWVASTPQQITNNMAVQNINVNSTLNGTRYIVQWGDTLWGISQATGISVDKLAYDNHIANRDLIFAGQVLILNRDGSVPADYHYEANPRTVAKTKIIINHNEKNVNINVSPVLVKKTENNTFVNNGEATTDQSASQGSAANSSATSGDKDAKSAESNSKHDKAAKMDDDEFLATVHSDVANESSLSGKTVLGNDDSLPDDDDVETTTVIDNETLSTTVKKNSEAAAQDVANEINGKLATLSGDDSDALKHADQVKVEITKDNDKIHVTVTVATQKDDEESSSSDKSSSEASEEESSATTESSTAEEQPADAESDSEE
ncbi:LysM peptidoglycan-binding domain-containing protein [Limosilactobacillus equigenerosi]|uniref:LysM domain-containing protein n=1 Tax=Limosilactobacillus equigenerosi DSM 18793 = JCM 14505 TaxID=1423742 RepID=A0A0R1UPT6_9LACO|nr:LysM domain-containing protein [Limosilactobacillus equigenerosi]KRL95206.1 hypothetical protein FC21_GL000794 [Limosilactobacillus equigenerosi DSM 18793 = JCM 14505]